MHAERAVPERMCEREQSVLECMCEKEEYMLFLEKEEQMLIFV